MGRSLVTTGRMAAPVAYTISEMGKKSVDGGVGASAADGANVSESCTVFKGRHSPIYYIPAHP